MAEDLPIDIHYNKLLDWLINRRHCKHEWQQQAMVIREKINNAIQDMPPVDEITQLLQGTYINYFHCLRIVELLKETESGTRNIFGRYSSQRMKDWQEIVKLYEKEGVNLAEAAQLLSRNVNFEIPGLKRKIAKCQQSQTDCTRKEGEYASNAAELKEKFQSQCKQMGIQGKKIKSELLALVKDLPTTLDRICVTLKEVKPATDYYSAFVKFTLAKDELGEQCTPTLRYVLQNGNTTMYEFRTGIKPESVEEPKLDISLEDEDEKPSEDVGDGIDWGDPGAGEIDFGITLDPGVEAIDFGDISVEEGEGNIDWGDGGATLDFEVVDTSEITVEPEDSAVSEGIVRGTDAMTILDNTETRNLLIDELLEVEAFLSQRIQEMKGESHVLSGSQFQSAPQVAQQDLFNVEVMLGHVQNVTGQLTTKKMQDLFLIRTSPRYVERVAESLKSILDSADKMLALSRLMVIRRQEALEEQGSTEPTLALIRKRTQELKKQIEGEISKKYQNRIVNIMGEINTI